MRRRPGVWALLLVDLQSWLTRPTFRVALALAVLVVVIALRGAPAQGAALFRTVLGGPAVGLMGGQLRTGPGWTGFVVGVLFLVACLGSVDTDPAWICLVLARGASRARWALARLLTLAVGAVLFFAVLVAVIGLAFAVGWRPGPFLSSATSWDFWLWPLGLISVAWFAMAVALVAGTVWPSLACTFLLLSLARFGGNLAPYIPFSQWIVDLHGLPGTLSVVSGVLYVAVWAIVSAGAVFAAAGIRLGEAGR
ncbi:MAG: hypothetical protein K6V97_14740 [Actinomycetia bacterium]|nr:hypothetical protein [Actinomycetes bacterium]